jgi:acetyltransferase
LLAEVEDGYLTQEAAFQVIEAYGIPAARWCSARTEADALAAAGALGFPVVIKAVSSELVHKSDVGGVAVDIRTPEELAAAVARIKSQMKDAGHVLEGFFLQELARGGHEVIFGVSTDPRFGPLLMFGLGGKYVEVFQDVRFAVTPLSRAEAEDVIRGIRGYRLLEGVRGEPPVDREFLAEMLLRLEQLVTDHPRIQELDINPFLATADRKQARALDVRIRVG